MLKNIYINSQGGLGFNLALSHILKEFKQVYDKVCVLSPYFDVFEVCPYVDAVYKPNEIRDFIFDAKNDDARLICERMYDSEDFIYKKVSYADAWRKEVDNAVVRKNCTIPNWLNKKAEAAGVNFSQVLQDALKKLLSVSSPRSPSLA